VVTNTGNVELTTVTLNDDKLGTIALNEDQRTLFLEESVTVSVNGTWVLGQHTNAATVNGSYGEITVTDTDNANFYGVKPHEPSGGDTGGGTGGGTDTKPVRDPDPNEVNIEDVDTPLSGQPQETPEVTALPDMEVPKGDAPEGDTQQNEEIIILDSEVPLGNLPQTGTVLGTDSAWNAGLLITVCSMALLGIGYVWMGRKPEEKQ